MNGLELLSQLMVELDEAFDTGRFRGQDLNLYPGVCNALSMELMRQDCPEAADDAHSLFQQACADLKQMDAIPECAYPVSYTHERSAGGQYAAAFLDTPAPDYRIMWTGDYGIARRRFVNTVSLILRKGQHELERTTGALASAMPAFEDFRKVVNASTFPSEGRGLHEDTSELMYHIAYASPIPFLCVAFREAGVRGFEQPMRQLMGTPSLITYALRRLQDRGTPIALSGYNETEFTLLTRIARLRYLRAYRRWLMELAQ